MPNKIITHKGNQAVDALDQNLIAQHNDLIKSVADMKKNSIKIFEIAVGALDTDNGEQREVQIKKDIIFDILDQTGHSRKENLRAALKDLQHNAVFHLLPNGDEKREILISPISKIEWSEREDYISIAFTPEILPYITLLKENFTQYKLTNIAKLGSKHSITLYKVLAMYANQYEYYSSKGNRSEKQLKTYAHPKITVEELHRLTNTEKQYKSFSLFRKNVLDKAVDEINDKTDLNVNYDKIRSGRYISDIQFHIKKEEADSNQENQKHIDTVKQTEAERELENAKAYADAMSSQFTQMLMERMLLNPTDMTNQTIMIGLGKNVYPKYQKIKAEQGLNALKIHLDYVHNHIGDWNRHTNIAKYLNKAVDDYLNKGC